MNKADKSPALSAMSVSGEARNPGAGHSPTSRHIDYSAAGASEVEKGDETALPFTTVVDAGSTANNSITTAALNDTGGDGDDVDDRSPSAAVKRGQFGARPACFKNTAQEVSFVFQATIATATSSFFTGVTAIVTASIGRDLGMTQGEITWITASTQLTAGAFQLGLGQLADLLGRKATFLAGMASFAAFTLLAAFARNPFWMDVVCGVLGVCAAMVVPPAIGIMGAAYGGPSRRKNLAFSSFSAGNPLGFVFGSVMCGVASRIFDWRAAFIFLAMLWAVFAVLAVWTVPKVEAYAPGEPLRARMQTFVRQFDAVGTLLTIFGTGLLTASITLGPDDGWRSAHVIAMLVLGVFLLLVFVYWEQRYPYPLMPPHIWKDRNFTFIILSCLPGYMGFMSQQFWLSYFMQELQGLSSLTVAVHLLPQAIAGLIWNIIAGNTLHRVNNTFLLALGSASYIASNVLLALMKADSLYWAFIFPALILGVVGADFQFNVANMYVMQSLPSHQQALAGGIFNTLFRLGSAISLGLSTAVYSSVAETAAAQADPMVPYTKAFYVCMGLSCGSFLFLPFVRLGTQGAHSHEPEADGAPIAMGAIPTGNVPLQEQDCDTKEA